MDCHFSHDLVDQYAGVYDDMLAPSSGHLIPGHVIPGHVVPGHVVGARRVVKKDGVQTPGLGIQLLTAGTAACVADIITFPLDTTKVRLQVDMTGPRPVSRLL